MQLLKVSKLILKCEEPIDFLVNGSFSFQNAQGTGDNPYSDNAEFGNPVSNVIYTPHYIVPLAFNHTFNGNLNIDYHFGINDGPDILHEFGASLLLTFSSGHPFTLASGTVRNLGTSDPNQVTIIDTRFSEMQLVLLIHLLLPPASRSIYA